MSNLPNNEREEKDRDEQTTGSEKTPDPAASGSTPPSGRPAGRPPTLYREMTFRDGETTVRRLTAKEVLAQDGTDVDFFWDQVFNRIKIRYPDGTSSGWKTCIPGLGPDAGVPFLEDILWAEGEFLAVERLNGRLTSVRDSAGARAKQVERLRTAFHDTAELGWFFVVLARPWQIAWNRDRSWRIIER